MNNSPSRRFLYSLGALVVIATMGLGSISPARAAGSSWSIVTSPNQGVNANQLSAIATVSPSDAWAVGSYYRNNTVEWQTLIEHWNGTSWSVVASPNAPGMQDFLYGVTALSASDIWAVGDVWNGAYEPLTEHWNGTVWSVVPAPRADGDTLYAVSGSTSNDVWAVGGNGAGALTMHWNGSQWSIASNPDATQARSSLRSVTALSSSNVQAVGSVPDGYGSSVALAER
jgi:hypothetical protein